MRNCLIILVISVLAVSCASKSSCPKEPAAGNLGALFNSKHDEYSPSVFENSLYYTRATADRKKEETILVSEFSDGRFSRAVKDTELPIYHLQNPGSLSFAYNSETGKLELYFSALSKNGKINRNLFWAENDGERWSQPKMINELNSSFYESHPAISHDGKTLVFASDRAEGHGGIDLYVSYRNPDGSWTYPLNIKNLNTESNEITPYIAQDGSLFFSSQGYGGGRQYNIVKAEADGSGLWHNPRTLQFPINTDMDETGPTIFKDRLILSSNRRNGCGNKDLYAFRVCGPVLLQVNLVSSFPDFPLAGKANLYGEDGELVSSENVDAKGFFQMELKPNNYYKIEYINQCQNDFKGVKNFYAPCSDTSVVVIKTTFEFNPQDEFDLEEVKVPFFVSGYYMPNTRENLEALRLKFAYNLIGVDESSKFIEKPGPEYDDFAEEVENSLNTASEHLYSIVAGLSDVCLPKNDSKIQISITGFADPRAISSKAVFPDADIIDEKYEFYLERGTAMDNLLLSKLRAYFTAKYFENYIRMKDRTGSISDRIIWKIEGKGVDTNVSLPDKMKRRVNIKIKPLE